MKDYGVNENEGVVEVTAHGKIVIVKLFVLQGIVLRLVSVRHTTTVAV
jgi:hypothetical protein